MLGVLTVGCERRCKDLLCVGVFKVWFRLELHQLAADLPALQDVDVVSLLPLLEQHAASDLLDVLKMLLHGLQLLVGEVFERL